MTGRLYIDGKDAYTTFGVFITEGGYKEMLTYPSLKKVPSNSWAEEDGDEFDLSSPAVNGLSFSLSFVAHNQVRTGSFLTLLSSKVYHTFDFREIGLVYKLRLVAGQNLTLLRYAELFSLQFACDNPLEGYKYSFPIATNVKDTGYELDNHNLADYGVSVLEGSLTEIMKTPGVKPNVMTDISTENGFLYQGTVVNFQTKDVKINCLMRANTLTEFWHNYNALLYDLIRPNERILYVDSIGMEYPCFYKSASVSKFFPKDKVWLEFSLVLTFTSFRIGDDEYFLATDDKKLILSEEGDFVIDLNIK